ncbi:hypothetical protein [Bartonella queenslandensis]|nr:hypothetical protein [Bartonella queenslandensis]
MPLEFQVYALLTLRTTTLGAVYDGANFLLIKRKDDDIIKLHESI